MLSSRTAQSLYQRSYFLSSTFFDIFLSFPNAFFKLSTRTLSGSPLRFCWYIAFIWLLKSCCLARQLIYNTTLSTIVNTFFKISFKFFQTSFLVLPNIHASTLRAAVRTPSQKQMFLVGEEIETRKCAKTTLYTLSKNKIKKL